MADQSNPEGAPEAIWALVEIFGHRRHYGRVSEVEKFGTKMMRVEVPTSDEGFATFFYGGASIFGMTPMTEEAARAWAKHERPPGGSQPLSLMPPRDFDDEERPF